METLPGLHGAIYNYDCSSSYDLLLYDFLRRELEERIQNYGDLIIRKGGRRRLKRKMMRKERQILEGGERMKESRP